MSSFPVNLSLSPVHEAFKDIQWDSVGMLSPLLSDQDRALLKAAEDNVIEYTLADQQEATAYVHILLSLLEHAVNCKSSSSTSPFSSTASSSPNKVSKIPLDADLTEEEALQMLYEDSLGVVTHYCVSKLCEITNCLKSGVSSTKKSSVKVTMASTFYPNGILIEKWRPLLRLLLSGGGTNVFPQRTFVYQFVSS